MEELRRRRALGVDLNADHLACWVLDPSGNPVGAPHTIPLRLDALPAATRGRLRNTISGIPTRRFRTVLAGMAANADLWVIAVDPGWTSRWGQRYWLAPLSQTTRSPIAVTGHHAAAVVIGRRGLGHGARRRPGVTRPHQRMGKGELPARPGDRALAYEGPGPPRGERAAASPHETRPAKRLQPGDQMIQDRSGPSVSVD
jgi:hypothetical protein